jgi:hypothetical protein
MGYVHMPHNHVVIETRPESLIIYFDLEDHPGEMEIAYDDVPDLVAALEEVRPGYWGTEGPGPSSWERHGDYS